MASAPTLFKLQFTFQKVFEDVKSIYMIVTYIITNVLMPLRTCLNIRINNELKIQSRPAENVVLKEQSQKAVQEPIDGT